LLCSTRTPAPVGLFCVSWGDFSTSRLWIPYLIHPVPTPALFHFILIPPAVVGVGAGVAGAGGLAAYIAILSSYSDAADAAMPLVHSDFSAYGDMIRGGPAPSRDSRSSSLRFLSYQTGS
jgi:hypothetical protein